jgi:hypothetical protein
MTPRYIKVRSERTGRPDRADNSLIVTSNSISGMHSAAFSRVRVTRSIRIEVVTSPPPKKANENGNALATDFRYLVSLRITKPLLYQLSYVGGKGQNIASSGASHKGSVAASLCEAIEDAACNTLYLSCSRR